MPETGALKEHPLTNPNTNSYEISGSSPDRTAPPADFRVEDHGSIFLLQPLTPAAQSWIDEHIPDDAQRLGSAIVVEHRYIADIVQGIRNDGLAVS